MLTSTVQVGLARLLVFISLLLWVGIAAAQQETPAPPAALPAVLDVRVSTTPERARLILDLSQKSEFAIVSISGPDRIAIDVRASELKLGAVPPVAGAGIVATFSIDMAEAGRARTQLILSQPAVVQQAYVLDPIADQPARLVVDLVLDTPEGFAERAAADLAAAMSPGTAQPPAAKPPAVSEAAGTRPLVVIDPGHGGLDNGASTPKGVHEKDIVLAYALALQELLVASGRFDVALTREDDTFLRLEDRVRLARENKADLFISLHADSFQQREIRGASVYTRDEKATDVLDKVLADSENKSDIIAGFAVPEMPPQVVDILVDLMRRDSRKQAYIAAQALVHQLEPSVQLRRFPVRQADFFVLQAPEVPSVLVELGFLSNADDIANLQQDGWRDRVVEALARGISAYFDGMTQQASVQ